MTKLSFILVGALAIGGVGCKKKAADGADCAKAIDHSMELSKADMSKMPGMDDKMMAKMRDVGVQHCNDDKWPEEARKCMVDAKTMADAQGCYGKLTQDQRDKMNKAAMDLATPPSDTTAGSGAPAQGSQGSAEIASGAAPSDQPGSAAGSAADGSAAGSGSAH